MPSWHDVIGLCFIAAGGKLIVNTLKKRITLYSCNNNVQQPTARIDSIVRQINVTNTVSVWVIDDVMAVGYNMTTS